MAQQRVYLVQLPPELLMHIAKQLGINDVSSLMKLNRRLNCLFFDYFFDRVFEKMLKPHCRPDDTPEEIRDSQVHTCRIMIRDALEVDSPRIMNYIKNRGELSLDESGFPKLDIKPSESMRKADMKQGGTMQNYYLVYAITEDAPRVVNWLLESGIQTVHGLSDEKNQKLMPLCLTLSKGDASTQEELDAALGTACTYLLPRTTGLLLERGANPKARTSNGTTAFGSLRRARERFELFYYPEDEGDGYKQVVYWGRRMYPEDTAARMLRILIHMLDPHETGCISPDIAGSI
ncbi:hypothetical protein F4679DRAFT_545198 [Xylaria curta]|nr:hypothetical protein F4679DRAFT_545198 [Xylaria curta]